jgi:pSer/pThr/pTyr-binding forkhead associated (FHA) protein
MAKLVLLSTGMTGRTHELKADKTTIGRVEDNSFQIAEASVSSHHCEILLKGNDVVVKDLNSTNGTFINGDRVSLESPLKPGQILRLGQIEMRLETETSPPQPKKPLDQTMVMQRGVSLTELETGARTGFGTKGAGFAKKNNKANMIILVVAIGLGVLIIGLLLYVFGSVKAPSGH